METLIGQTFGKLLVIDNDGLKLIGKSNRQMWKCKCDCGNIRSLPHWSIVNRTRSCGCVRYPKLDLIGQRFGRLLVLSLSHTKRTTYWQCKCDCGNECVIRSNSLTLGSTKSCGCLMKVSGKAHRSFGGLEEISGATFDRIRKGSIRNGRILDFTISIEYIWSLFLTQNRKCAISGVPIRFPTNSRTKNGNASLDRIDSSKGYIEGNVQWVHKDINSMKSNFKQNYFVEMCRNVVDNQNYGVNLFTDTRQSRVE